MKVKIGKRVIGDGEPVFIVAEIGVNHNGSLSRARAMVNYTGYPMVKLARDLIRAGEFGKIRRIVVRYSQGWLSTPLERTGHMQASWRTDPKQSGGAGCMGDIGTHAEMDKDGRL